MKSLIVPFLTGGTVVSIVNYFSKSDKPEIAAILTTFPIGLLAMYFIDKKEKLHVLGKSLIWTNMAIILTYICMVLIIEYDIPVLNDNIIIASFVLWVLFAMIFFRIAKKIHS